MNRNRLLKWVNPVLFVSALIQILTGIALSLPLFNSQPKLLAPLFEIHQHNGIILTVIIIIHLSLNWNWVASQFFKRRNTT